ncbi:S24 family peptidase [Capnocytophaga sputigena]|uniref:S24 family peptidase n=1 Tax=Capnocytophaga sputigena TaxID=1019 RepID=UPI003C75E9D0
MENNLGTTKSSIKKIADRLKKAIRYIKGSTEYSNQTLIAEKIDFGRTNLSAALNGEEKYLTEGLISKVTSAFPEINKDWLLTGNGEMLVQNTPEEEDEEDELATFLRVERKNYDIPLIDISEKTGIPQKLLKDFQWGDAELSDEYRDRLYYFIEEVREYFVNNAIGEAKGKPTGYYYPEVSASAGFDIATFNNEAMRIPIYLPEFGKDIIFINVYGDSMYPKYKSGDMIGVKPTDFQYVVFGHPYVVVFDNGDVNIKYVCKGSDNEHVNLVSENPQYEPREYPLSIIRSFYTVKGCVNRERM